MEININGMLFVNEEMSHQEFIYKLMRALKRENLHFVGTTRQLEVSNTYDKK